MLRLRKFTRDMILEVLWHDAASSSNWEDEDMVFDAKPEWPCQSLGYFWGSTKTELYIMALRTLGKDKNRVSSTHSIPWGMIQSVRIVGKQGKYHAIK